MIRAIVAKELRETWTYPALALVLYFTYLNRMMGNWSHLLCWTLGWLPGVGGCAPAPDLSFPFVNAGFNTVYGFIGCSLAIFLGLRQSAWEPSQGTAHYLLHLPLTRNAIFLTKLFTGIGVQLACTLLPILIYAGWTAFPGTHHAPFYWSMTGPTLQVWLVMPLLYLGAFASGIRPARWYGSRLLPLVAAAIPCVLLQNVPMWWLIGFPLLLLVAATLISEILFEAKSRDY